MSFVKAILDLVAPPAQPLGNDFAWEDIESHLNVDFPVEFKALVSLYGTGTFIPSGVQLCNYRDSRGRFLDILAHWAQRDSDSSDTPPFPVFPASQGLIPFAFQTLDHIFFLNPARLPWSVVCIHQQGAHSEEIENLDCLEFIWRLFSTDSSSLPNRLTAFLAQRDLTPQRQRYVGQHHKPQVEDGVCLPIAAGARRISYRIGGLVEVAVPEELHLSRAQNDVRSVERFRVEWQLPSSHYLDEVAPSCSFGIVLRPTVSDDRPLPEQWQLLSESHFAGRSRSERGTIDYAGGVAYWILASDTDGHDQPNLFNIVVLGTVDGCGWELFITVVPQFLDRYFDLSLQTVKSIRGARAGSNR